jgi:hypothetical protein
MREWGRTIAMIDNRFEAAIREALLTTQVQRSFVVTDSFDGGTEMLTDVGA